MSYDYLFFEVVSPTAGLGRDGLISGNINSSALAVKTRPGTIIYRLMLPLPPRTPPRVILLRSAPPCR